MSEAIVPSPSIELAWTPEALKDEVEREKALRAVVVDYYKSQLRQGHHYYNLPGEGEQRKPALAKEGALNLCSLFKVTPEPDEPHETLEPNGHYTVRFRYRLRSVRTGQIVATGDGSCSTREAKYAYRWAWPSELDPATKARAEAGEIPGKRVKTKNGWVTKYRLPNPDLADTYNTVLKMGSKRALVDAALKLPLVSELFTQDLEELIAPDVPDEPNETPPEPRKNAIARLNRAFTGAGLTKENLRDKAREMFGRPTIAGIVDLSDAEVSQLADEVEALVAATR